MNTTIENLPQVWDDERDELFFRISALLFAPDFCYGASVLLASYDNEAETATTTVMSDSLRPPPQTALRRDPPLAADSLATQIGWSRLSVVGAEQGIARAG